MSAPAAEAPAKPKSKKMLIIIAAVLALVLIAGAATLFLLQGKSSEDSDGEEQSSGQEEDHDKAKNPPQFMPIDPIVVNLADPDTPRFAQVGITLQLEDAHTADQVKAYMPSIRNGILLKMSAQTSAELLRPEGKTKLAEEILALVREKTGLDSKKKNPVQAVLFSSIIVQ